MNKLIFNYLLEFKKKQISYIERAQLIQQYLDDNNMSQRALGKELGIPHSTIQDWLMWNKLDNNNYLELKNQGLNDTKIYSMLRNGKRDDKRTLMSSCMLDVQIEDSIRNLKNYTGMIDIKISSRTRKKLDELYEILNKILIKVKK